MDVLSRLENWYLSQCYDEWEHMYGVVVDTLDNPGWTVTVDLIDTECEEKAFEEIDIKRSETDWIICRKKGNIFDATGGPQNLKEIFTIFLDWAEGKSDLK